MRLDYFGMIAVIKYNFQEKNGDNESVCADILIQNMIF